MDNIELAETRMADKLQNAFVLNVYAAAENALQKQADKYGIVKPLTSEQKSYEDARNANPFAFLKGPIGILLGILFVVFIIGAR